VECVEYDEPLLEGYVTVPWSDADHWFEEDEEAFIHPRDPFTAVHALESTRHVELALDGVRLADSRAPVLLFETGLPTRYYLPREDFVAGALRDSSTHTQCPYKGTASYHDVVVGDERHADLVWFYDEPLPEVAAIAGRLAAFNERVDITVDGELQERPESPWTRARSVR